ncbi:MAG: hypothetical protein WCK78_16170 [Paludibacter sp.]
MKKSILFFCFLIFTANIVKVDSQTSFSGNWNSSKSDFYLSLKQIKNKISGCHCSAMLDGNRIDCSTDEETINGTVQGDSILVVFTSAYSMKNGFAVIKRVSDKQIEWKIKKKPDGEFYIPTGTILIKE